MNVYDIYDEGVGNHGEHPDKQAQTGQLSP